jgi:hypothetical protein
MLPQPRRQAGSRLRCGSDEIAWAHSNASPSFKQRIGAPREAGVQLVAEGTKAHQGKVVSA